MFISGHGLTKSQIKNIVTIGDSYSDAINPFEIPEEFAEELIKFNRHPPAWWIGQLVRMFARETDAFNHLLQDRIKTMHFSTPIVG